MQRIISKKEITNRCRWVENLQKLGGHFRDDTDRMQKKLASEIKKTGINGLLGHLRLCGAIPESFGHDSSEEKLYSKYTDTLIAETFNALECKSLVLQERANSADVEVFAPDFTFVADAKAFRLSRTAKNVKDFKVQAMDGWRRRPNDSAMVVCPIYQLPASKSQVYAQATTRNVCIFTFSHLALLLAYSRLEGVEKAQAALKRIFRSVLELNPSENSINFWSSVNKTMLDFSPCMAELWQTEKRAVDECISIAKKEALTFLAEERERIMRMNHREALEELVRSCKIESKTQLIQAVKNNDILGIQ